jgi:serine/threonine protein kinase/tetratricopeptide (TPR) repeat protein
LVIVNSLRTSLRTLSIDDSQPADPEFERLIEQITARLQDGERIDLEQLADEHPAYADEVRDLLPALEMLARIGEAPQTRHATNGDAPHPAQQQLGDYRIIRELGRGGMGVVYEAEQISLGRRVALKVLPFAGILDEQQLARFKNEARAAATLHHEHIVPIHAVGSERGVHFYAMQLVEGQSLAQVIEQLRAESRERGVRSRRPPLPPVEDSPWRGEGQGEGALEAAIRGSTELAEVNPKSEIATPPVARLSTVPDVRNREYWQTVARLGIEAAQALDHAHQNGVLHRDIKPANLLVDNAGKLWITDFGLARMEADAGMTMSGDLLGTLRYMSPEQALANRAVVDHRIDIYSLGATLYELLTLEPAFGESDRSALLKRIAFDEPRPPRQIHRGIPIELETIVLKAMRKSPDERYATAQNLAEDLQSFLDNKPIKAKPPTWREQALKWSRRHPAAIWATVLALMATTVVSAASAVLVGRAYQREAMHRKLAEDERVRLYRNLVRSITVSEDLLNASFGYGEWGSLPSNWRVKLAEPARKYYESLLQEESSDPKLQFARSIGYRSLAEINYQHSDYVKAEPNLRQSVAILEQLCREAPETIDYHEELAAVSCRLGMTLHQLGQHDEGKSRLETSFRIYRDVIVKQNDYVQYPALHSIDALAQELVRRGETSSTQFEDLIGTCRKIVARHQHSGVARESLVGLLDAQGRLDEAIAECRELVRRDPKELEWQFKLGVLLYRKGLLDEAIASFRGAVRLDPNNAIARNNLGSTLRKKSLLDEAIAELRESIRIDPNDAAAHLNLGLALEEIGIPDEATDAFREAIRLDPKGSSDSHALLGNILHDQGSVDDASSEYQAAITLDREAYRRNPDDAGKVLQLARRLVMCSNQELREPEEAVLLAKRAAELTPGDARAWSILGLAQYRAADYRGAVESVRKGYELSDREDWWDFFLLAMAEWQLGNREAAQEWYATAIDWLKAHPQLVGGNAYRFRAEAKELLEIGESGHADIESMVGPRPGRPLD